MKKLLFIVLFSGALLQGNSQEKYLSTPRQSVETHLYYLQEETYNDSLARLPFSGTEENSQEELKSAIKLKQILDGKGIYIEVSEIPSRANFYDSTSRKHQYILTTQFPEIYLQLNKTEWTYPTSSLNAIDRIHKEVFPFGTDRLLNLLPKFGTNKIFGLYIFQYVAIFMLALIAILIQKVLTLVFNKLFLRFVKQAGYEHLATGFLLPIAQPASIFVVLLFSLSFVPVLQLPPNTSYYVTAIFKIAIPLFGTIVFYRMANILSLYLERMARKTTGTLDDQLVPLVRKTLKTFIVVMGTLFVLSNLNIDILPLLTGLSIGGLAFALAAQDTIKNFFGSLMIFIDKPFQIGDWVTSGDIDGTVEEVGFRSSRVRTFRNSLVYVPNGHLADSTIDNHGLRTYRRFFTTIGVTYDTPPSHIQIFIDGLEKIVKEHPDTRKDNYNIFLNDLGASSLNIMFYIFFKVPSWNDELRARHQVILEIMKLAEQLGIQFAFPTQTLHVENIPGKPSNSPIYMNEEETQQKLDQFFIERRQ